MTTSEVHSDVIIFAALFGVRLPFSLPNLISLTKKKWRGRKGGKKRFGRGGKEKRRRDGGGKHRERVKKQGKKGEKESIRQEREKRGMSGKGKAWDDRKGKSVG